MFSTESRWNVASLNDSLDFHQTLDSLEGDYDEEQQRDDWGDSFEMDDLEAELLLPDDIFYADTD